MKTVKNWSIQRSGAGLVIRHDERTYWGEYGKITRVKEVVLREGKIIAIQAPVPGYDAAAKPNVEWELLPPVVPTVIGPGLTKVLTE